MPIDIPTLLNKNKNKIIQLKIRDNKTIKGILQNFDIHMNLTLEDTEDISGINVVKLGKILLRGNNIIIISFPEESK
ncbi:MAG: LSM domain-containing protein [Nitrosopumilus sp.]|nr:ribonucleoprotein [Nitrososphaerota archaeon]